MEASFGKIQLPNFLLVDLFKDNLVLYDDLPPTNSIKQIKESSISAIESVEKLISTMDTSKKWYLGGNNKQITIAKTLKKFEAQFRLNKFIRIHKSYLVNKENIPHFTSEKAYEIPTILGNSLPISRRKLEIVRKNIR